MTKRDGTRRGWVPSARDAEAEVRGWLDTLDVQIPKPAPIFFDRNMNEVDEVADEDEVLRIDPDWPDRDDLASAVVGMVRDADTLFPSARHWSRWKTIDRVSSWLYRLGIIGGGGGCSMGGGDPVGGWVYHLPPLAALRWKRQYLVGLPRWWWECQLRQGLRLTRHRPERPWAFGVCAACAPCPDCGEHRDCKPTCAMSYGPVLAPVSTPPERERR